MKPLTTCNFAPARPGYTPLYYNSLIRTMTLHKEKAELHSPPEETFTT